MNLARSMTSNNKTSSKSKAGKNVSEWCYMKSDTKKMENAEVLNAFFALVFQ